MNEPQTNQAPAAGLTPPRRPRIGLALGSGSARGLAHIGVLRALKEANIEVDLVAGTSMGAVIGAVFASGKLDGLSARLCNLDWPGIVALLDPVFPRSGLIDGQRVAEFVRAHVPSAHIESLLLPFAAVATDLMTGEAVVATAGDLTEAVRASIAVPGIVTPVRSNGRILVDGGLVNPVPVRVARAMGADLVIAVDLNHDIVSGRLSHPVAHANGHAPIMARLLESLQAINSPVLAQFEAWLHKVPKEPLPGIFDVLLASPLHHAGARHRGHFAARPAGGPDPAAIGRGALHGIRPRRRNHRNRLPQRSRTIGPAPAQQNEKPMRKAPSL
jgi:NTE family protein